MRNLLKKQIDWLYSAVRGKEELRIFSIMDTCAIATDGHRMHIINAPNLPDVVDGTDIASILKVFDGAETVSKIKINPRFLIDALRIFDNQESVDIDVININLIPGNEGIIINGDNNTALIMCVAETSGEKNEQKRKDEKEVQAQKKLSN
jgi:hypothetical protein